MAGFHSAQRLRSSILSLPASLRTPTYNHCRYFSASQTRSSPVVEFIVAGPIALLEGIHSFGVPWYATIPLTAALVRSTFLYYVTVRPSRQDAAIRAALVPLVHAQANLARMERRDDDERPKNGRVKRQKDLVLERVKQVMSSYKAMHRTARSFGAQPAWPKLFFNFGAVLTFAEAIRMKCGAREGLLRIVESSVRSFWTSDSSERLSAAEALAARLEKRRELELEMMGIDGGGGDVAIEPTQHIVSLESLAGPDTSSPYFDHLIQLEGLPWCTDLTVADPTVILPGTLGLVFVASILIRPTATPLSLPTDQPSKSPISSPPSRVSKTTLGQKMALVLSPFLIMVSTQLPAGILLYIIPSIATGWLQTRFLDLKSPIPNAIRPCARPVRMKVRRSW